MVPSFRSNLAEADGETLRERDVAAFGAGLGPHDVDHRPGGDQGGGHLALRQVQMPAEGVTATGPFARTL